MFFIPLRRKRCSVYWIVKICNRKDFKYFNFFSQIIRFRPFWIYWYAYRNIIIKKTYSFIVSAKSRFLLCGAGKGDQNFADMSATNSFFDAFPNHNWYFCTSVLSCPLSISAVAQEKSRILNTAGFMKTVPGGVFRLVLCFPVCCLRSWVHQKEWTCQALNN